MTETGVTKRAGNSRETGETKDTEEDERGRGVKRRLWLFWAARVVGAILGAATQRVELAKALTRWCRPLGIMDQGLVAVRCIRL
jgi:hypothetical protein